MSNAVGATALLIGVPLLFILLLHVGGRIADWRSSNPSQRQRLNQAKLDATEILERAQRKMERVSKDPRAAKRAKEQGLDSDMYWP